MLGSCVYNSSRSELIVSTKAFGAEGLLFARPVQVEVITWKPSRTKSGIATIASLNCPKETRRKRFRIGFVVCHCTVTGVPEA
jgi:hypothetical protein